MTQVAEIKSPHEQRLEDNIAITCQADAGEAVFITFRGTFQYILEAGIHYGCLCGYNAVQGVNLFIGVV